MEYVSFVFGLGVCHCRVISYSKYELGGRGKIEKREGMSVK